MQRADSTGSQRPGTQEQKCLCAASPLCREARAEAGPCVCALGRRQLSVCRLPHEAHSASPRGVKGPSSKMANRTHGTDYRDRVNSKAPGPLAVQGADSAGRSVTVEVESDVQKRMFMRSRAPAEQSLPRAEHARDPTDLLLHMPGAALSGRPAHGTERRKRRAAVVTPDPGAGLGTAAESPADGRKRRRVGPSKQAGQKRKAERSAPQETGRKRIQILLVRILSFRPPGRSVYVLCHQCVECHIGRCSCQILCSCIHCSGIAMLTQTLLQGRFSPHSVPISVTFRCL